MSDRCISTNVIKRTRKSRQCVWCGQGIPVGSAAVSNVYTFDGNFNTDYYHPECRAAMRVMDDIGDGFPAYEWGRGRADDRKDLPPVFGPDGKRINDGATAP